MNSISIPVRARGGTFLFPSFLGLALAVATGCGGTGSSLQSPSTLPLTITGSISLNAANGMLYSSTDQATGGTPAYTWSIVSGALPPGLALAATTGTISGTPTQDGTYHFTLKVVEPTDAGQLEK